MTVATAILAIDFVLAVLALEAAALILARRPLSRRRSLDVLLMLAPAAFLVAAIRAALVGAQPELVLALVTASLPVHLADLRRRGVL